MRDMMPILRQKWQPIVYAYKNYNKDNKSEYL